MLQELISNLVLLCVCVLCVVCRGRRQEKHSLSTSASREALVDNREGVYAGLGKRSTCGQ